MDTKLCKPHNNGEGAMLPRSSFANAKNAADGLYPYCRECAKAKLAEWRHLNPDKHKTTQEKWKKANPEKVREINRIAKAKWRSKDLPRTRELERAQAAKWRAENPEKYKEKNRVRLKQQRAKNPEFWRKYHLKSVHGVSVEWYEQRYNEQKGLCAICGGVPKRRLAVDHNHKTGQRRGLLCGCCNTALERMETVENWHDKALAYLSKHEEPYFNCDHVDRDVFDPEKPLVVRPGDIVITREDFNA